MKTKDKLRRRHCHKKSKITKKSIDEAFKELGELPLNSNIRKLMDFIKKRDER